MLSCFAIALFTSASLLFWVQPMVAKMILPALGGSPSVWNTCMVFFQAVLLAGYLYAHLGRKWLGSRKQAVVHLALFAAAVATLPIDLDIRPPEGTDNPSLWLFARLALSAGLPLFVISATAPMLQSWFSRTGHPHSADPYFLYGASNIGSMAALFGYPALIEPFLSRTGQSRAWALGYLALGGLILACAALARRAVDGKPAEPPSEAGPESASGSPVEILRWIALAFAPSSLLLGVTTLITTDVTPVPLLWVVPLALYLLTFVIVFARKPLVPHRWAVRLQPFVLVPLAAVIALRLMGGPAMPWLQLAGFFMTALVCHGELARTRPSAGRLTAFYLWMSVGGVLGGLFNAFVAPAMFKDVTEYPLVLVLALLLRPPAAIRPPGRASRLLDIALPVAVLAATLAMYRFIPSLLPMSMFMTGSMLAFALPAAACLLFMGRPVRLALGLGAVILAGQLSGDAGPGALFRERNFFGVSRVIASPDGAGHILFHGNTMHGSQLLDPALRGEPLHYYTRSGPLGQIVEAAARANPNCRAAVLGLGAGAIAAYGKPGQAITFYEIDPVVERIARDPRLFTFLHDARATVRVVTGDARLKLAEAPDGAYDLIVCDVFSSDAIPVHLLTREAFGIYLRKLAPGGMLAFNISNRYLNPLGVLADLSRDAGVQYVFRVDRSPDPDPAIQRFKAGSTWVAIARTVDALGPLAMAPEWMVMLDHVPSRLWTDDYTNLIGTFRWKSILKG